MKAPKPRMSAKQAMAIRRAQRAANKGEPDARDAHAAKKRARAEAAAAARAEAAASASTEEPDNEPEPEAGGDDAPGGETGEPDPDALPRADQGPGRVERQG